MSYILTPTGRRFLGEETIEEKKEKFVLVDKNNKVVATGTDERDLKLSRRSLERKFGELKLVQTKKKQSVGYPLEESNKDGEDVKDTMHDCATHVVHEEYGEGITISEQHADPDENGQIEWYTVAFRNGLTEKVSTKDIEITKSESHMHSKKKK